MTRRRPFALLLAGALFLPALSALAAELSEGEVRKIDKENQKITLKHGEIKNLDMPPMTMVFRLKDPAWFDKLKVGAKVRFAAERSAAGMVVTELQLLP
ncbi:copper-binding protein [Paucibacter soli]|uniref:copper-binding protein n=1 Tax=Paucibacter soli TaxID=3133433 RepID=UPI0030ABED23